MCNHSGNLDRDGGGRGGNDHPRVILLRETECDQHSRSAVYRACVTSTFAAVRVPVACKERSLSIVFYHGEEKSNKRKFKQYEQNHTRFWNTLFSPSVSSKITI